MQSNGQFQETNNSLKEALMEHQRDNGSFLALVWSGVHKTVKCCAAYSVYSVVNCEVYSVHNVVQNAVGTVCAVYPILYTRISVLLLLRHTQGTPP